MNVKSVAMCAFTLLIAGCHGERSPGETLHWSAFKPTGQHVPAALSRLKVTLLPKPGGATMAMLNSEINWLDDKKKAQIPVTITDEAGFGADTHQANAHIEIHGHSTRLATQKSYTLKLKKSAGLWHGVRKITLNKHPYDLTRMRNKLTFDLLQGLSSELPSLETRFVHLTLGGADYGLFTQVQEPNKLFLKAAGLDPAGVLYKTERFEFNRDADVLRNSHDPLYNQAKFGTRLEFHGKTDHSDLLAMLDKVNDSDSSINEVVDTYFDRKNYLTWLAVNILMQNLDTNNQNFYLYHPKGPGVFLFIPWDYDGAWDWYHQPDAMAPHDPNAPSRWQTAGVANWWSIVLHQRFLREPGNIQALTARVDDLAEHFFTHERLAALIEAYKPVVKAEITQAPDFSNLPVKGERLALWESEVNRLYGVIPAQQKHYHQTLNWPMPFFLGRVQALDTRHTFTWNPSFSLVGDSLHYDFKLSRAPVFDAANRVIEKTGLKDTSLTLDTALKPGTYYWQIVARDDKDPQNAWEFAFDKLLEDGRSYPGVAEFTVD